MSAKRRADGPPVKRRPAKPRRTAGQHVRRVFKTLLVLGLVLGLLGVLAVVVLYRAIAIPQPNEAFKAQTTFVYYSGGKEELGTFYDDQNRVSIPLSQMPQRMQDAVVAAENRTFWTDQGIDPKGILRAAFSNARGNDRQGASTITQQYVKILYLTSEQSYQRKIKEAIVSLKIQNQLSKAEILEGYLNTIYFGRGAYGVQAAAKAFFDKDAAQLNLRESAVLATVLNNPSRYDPDGGKEARKALKERFTYVLESMAEIGSITAKQADKAVKRLPKFPEIAAQSQYGGQRGHMLSLVKKELLATGRFTEEEIDGGGLRITTTFTPQAMQAVEAGVEEQRPEGFGDKQLHVGAATVEVRTGALRGFYGGQDYLDSQINWAVSGGMAGSTFKAATDVAAIRDGFSLNDTFEGNSPIDIAGTEFENQGDTDYGSSVSMLDATENSINTAFVDMVDAMDGGPEKVIQAAQDLGIPGSKPGRWGIPNASVDIQPNVGVTLGTAQVSPINMANAYATLAGGGSRSDVHVVEKVVDRGGETIYSYKPRSEQTIDEDIAADVSYALQQVVESGSGTEALALARPAAGKTGTATNDDGEVSSSWFVGYTPQMATAVMYVRGKGREALDGWLPTSSDGKLGYFGGNYPAKTWTSIMQTLMEGRDVEDFPEPVYVDGDAPDDGHEPYTPPPTTTAPPQPQPTRKPSRTPTIKSQEPSPTETPTQTPTETVTPTPTLSPTPTPTPTPTVPTETAPPPSEPTTSPTAAPSRTTFASPTRRRHASWRP